MTTETTIDGVRAALDEIQAIDHHAHLLRRDDGDFSLGDDAAPLSELVLESNDPDEARRYVRDHPSYMRSIRDLATVLAVDAEEEAVAAARKAEGYSSYTHRLLRESRIEAMFVDDGLRRPDLLRPNEQQDLLGIPSRRVARIETMVEDAAEGWPPFDEVRERFRTEVDAALRADLIAMKTIAAFRCGLDLPVRDDAEARAGYERWRTAGARRLVEPGVISFFLFEALEVTRPARLPLQVHTGLVGTDVELRAGDPAPLRRLLNLPPLRDIPVVLLHCYPFIREASWLGGLCPNVYLDLSMILQWVVHRGADLILEAIDVAPVSKLLFATDGFRVPELFFLGAKWWRDDLAMALAMLEERGNVDRGTALEWGRLVLRDNALRIYPFPVASSGA